MNGLGRKLRTLRHSTMMSQEKFAKQIGSSQSVINRYENDQSEPPCDIFLKYADYFNVSMDYLYGRTDKPGVCHMNSNRSLIQTMNNSDNS